jgi:hypothetical protein
MKNMPMGESQYFGKYFGKKYSILREKQQKSILCSMKN